MIRLWRIFLLVIKIVIQGVKCEKNAYFYNHCYFNIFYFSRICIGKNKIRLTGYYFYSITPRIQLSFLGGTGFYSGTYKLLSLLHEIEHFTDEIGTTFDEGIMHLQKLKAKYSGFGFHFGIGFEFRIKCC